MTKDPVIAGNTRDFDPRTVRKLRFYHVPGRGESQTQHVETWPKIGNSSRSEDPESSFH
jgi:hypothetical protein